MSVYSHQHFVEDLEELSVKGVAKEGFPVSVTIMTADMLSSVTFSGSAEEITDLTHRVRRAAWDAIQEIQETL